MGEGLDPLACGVTAGAEVEDGAQVGERAEGAQAIIDKEQVGGHARFTPCGQGEYRSARGLSAVDRTI
jgi:hypothetical protein